MATATITNTGATVINGDVSLDPGTACGLTSAQVNGTIHINDTVTNQARADLLTAYNFAKGLAPDPGLFVVETVDLGGVSMPGHVAGNLPPGVYSSASTMLVSTPIVLDAGGNANAVWVFQIGSSLTTNGTGNISLANGAQAMNVFWVPTASATIGSGTVFYGTILAGVSVTAVTGATINGRLLAGAIDDTGNTGTVTLDTNTIVTPVNDTLAIKWDGTTRDSTHGFPGATNPAAWTLSNILLGSPHYTTDDPLIILVVKNAGGIKAQLTVSCGNADPWIVGATAGYNVFEAGVSTPDPPASYTSLAAGGVQISAGLVYNATQPFELYFKAPLTTNSVATKNINVTVTATAAP